MKPYSESLFALRGFGVVLATVFASIGWAQVFPDSPIASSDPKPAAATSAPPSKRVVKGEDADHESRERGDEVEHEEDESMVLKRMEYEQRRHRLALDEDKTGRAKLRLQGLDNIRGALPVPRALPQLPTAHPRTAAALAAGPSADPAAPGVSLAGQIFGSKWVELGPNVVYNGQPASGARVKVAGRTTCAAFDPSDLTYQTIYIGGADGGVWKTTNHGGSWAPLTDFQPTLAIGCITVNAGAPNEVYVGTGEAVLSGDAQAGAGILVSTDAGANWVSRQAATMANSQVAQIAVDRQTSVGATRRIIAATFSGIYVTNDAFQSVSLVQSGRFNSVLQDLNNSQVWWATRTTGGSTGLYKSINNGATWTVQNSGVPTNLTGGLADMVQAASNPNVMYAVFNGAADYSKLNIYKSTNGGANWSQIDNSYTTSVGSGQFFYNVYVAVNPTNENEIYVSGAAPIYRSINGGSSFTNVASNRAIHADHQFGMFRPNGTRYYDCNDGGIFYTDNPGVSDWVSLNTGLGLLQVNAYALALHPTRFEIMAGTQDNGTCRYLGSGIWNLVNFGDGGVTLWDPTDANYAYNGYVYSSISRSNIAGYGWDDISPNSSLFPSNSYSFPFYPKAALNPSNVNMLLLAGDSLLRNSTAKVSAVWADITGKLQPGNEISAVAFAPGNIEVCYIGFENGKVYRTGNISAILPTWSLIMTHPSSSYCSDLAVDPYDANHVVGVFYRFTNNQVYEITAADATPVVTSRSTGFPAIAANTVALDTTNPSVWYVGTEIGVYRSLTAGTSWQNFSTGLPNVAVDDLTLDNSRSIMLAGTHGRGVWMVARPEIQLANVTINDLATGNGNGSIDQNERIKLTINLLNTGSEDATGVTAALAGINGGTVVTQGNSAYPTLVKGGAAQANVTDFEIATLPNLAAGKQLSFLLTVASNLGNFYANVTIYLQAGVATTLVNLTEGFESGFGGFTQTNQSGVNSAWQADTSKPATGARCAHFEEPYPYEYELDHLKSPVTSIPASANRVAVSFDQTNASVLDGLGGGKVFLVKDGGAQLDIISPLVGILNLQNGYTGKFYSSGSLVYPGQDGYVNGGPGLPYNTTALELDPTVWAGHTLQVVFTYNFWGYDEKLNGPTGWFIDNYKVKAENYSIQAVAGATDWQLLH